MRFVNAKYHAILDYATAVLLMVAPFLLNFSGSEKWLSVGAGAALLTYSLLTGYSLGVRSLISFPLHLATDFVAGATFLVAPFILGFTGLSQGYYFMIGATVILLVLVTDPATDSESSVSEVKATQRVAT